MDGPRAPARAAPATGRRAAPIALALFGLTALVHARAVGLDFVHWDDHGLLVENAAYRGLGPAQLRFMVTSVLLGHYVPVTWLSFALDYLAWGLWPGGFHLTSVLLHAANATLAFLLGRRLLDRATTWPGGVRDLAAAVAAGAWALHPLRVEAVAWVTGRRDVLATFFLLLALAAYVAAAGATGRRRRWRLAGAVAAYALALGAKAVVMTAPLALVVLDLYPLRRLPGDPRRWADPAARPVWREKVPFAALALLGAAASYVGQARGSGVRVLTAAEWLGKVSYAVSFQLTAHAWPSGLSPLYELGRPLDLAAPRFAGSLALAALVTLALVGLRRRWPAGLAAWAWQLVFLAPVSAMTHAGPQITADRYTYIPGLATGLLLGAGAGVIAAGVAAGRLPRGLGRALAAAGLGALGGLAVLTWHQIGIWQDTGRLWAHASAVEPDCVRCRINLGNWRMGHGNPEGALADFAAALRLDPGRVRVHANVGLALVRLGRPAEAVGHYERVLAAHPDALGTRVSLAEALVELGRLDEAVDRVAEAGGAAAPAELSAFFEGATTARPDAPVPRLGLFLAVTAAGDGARAEGARAALARVHPALAEAAVARARPGSDGPGRRTP